MKKILGILIITILLIPYVVNAAQCDTTKVYINSITVEDKTGNVKELEKATAEDKLVNLNLRMSTKEDEIVYKITLKNDSKEDYEINKNSIKLDTNFMDYTLESDNNNIVKANSTKTIFLRVKYKTEIDPDYLDEGVYQDNVTMKVDLSSDSNESLLNNIVNPNTGVKYYIIISLIIIVGIMYFVLRKRKLSKLMLLIGIILIPMGVNALCKCEIKIESKVKIQIEDKGKIEIKACSFPEEYTFTYRIGMKLNEIVESDYFNLLDWYLRVSINDYINDMDNHLLLIGGEDFNNCTSQLNRPNYNDYQNDQEYYNDATIYEDQYNLCLERYTTETSFDTIAKSKDEATYIVLYTGNCGTT